MTSLFDWSADRYPEAPGHKGIAETSRDAAKAAKPTAALLRQRVLEQLEHSRGLTSDECAARLKLSVLSVRPRFSELLTMKLIRDTGARRVNVSGRNAVVWAAITPANLKPKDNA